MFKIVFEHWRSLTVDGHTIKVSSLGRVKEGRKILEQRINNRTGYLVVKIGIVHTVHRLVARAFLNDNLSKFDTIDHVDGNRRNNSLKNLEVVSQQENLRRAKANLISDIDLNADTIAFATRKIQAFNKTFKSFSSAVNYAMQVNKIPKEQKNVVITGALCSFIKRVPYLGTVWSLELKMNWCSWKKFWIKSKR